MARFNLFNKRETSKGTRDQITNVQAPVSRFNTWYQGLWNGDSNADFNLNEAEKNQAVLTCISIISQTVSKLQFVIKDGEGNVIKDDLHYILNYAPNSWQTKKLFLDTLLSLEGFYGNSYAKIYGSGKRLNFQILPSGYITDFKLKNGKLWYYSQSDDSVHRSEDLLHFKQISKDGVFGISKIDALRTAININYKSQKTVDKFYSRNAQSTKYLEFQGGTFGDNQGGKIDEIIEAFEKSNSGYDNAGKITAIPPMFKLGELKLSVEDAKFLESAKFTEESIASMFGCPVYLLGHSQPTFASFEQAMLQFKNGTISSIIAMICSELEFKLLTEQQKFLGYNIDMDTEPLVGITIADKANYYKTMKDMGVATLDEIAAKTGFKGVGGELGGMHWMQMQYIPVEKWQEYIAMLKGVQMNNNDSNNDKNDNK